MGCRNDTNGRTDTRTGTHPGVDCKISSQNDWIYNKRINISHSCNAFCTCQFHRWENCIKDWFYILFIWSFTSQRLLFTFYILPFLYSVILTEYDAIDPRTCVCLSVFVISIAQTDGPIWMNLSTNHLLHIYSIHFSPILKIQNWWRHGGHFNCFWFGLSHGRNFTLIFFKS